MRYYVDASAPCEGNGSKEKPFKYINDKALYEATSLEACIKAEKSLYSWVPEESIYQWYTEQDEANDMTVLYANFQGIDPNTETVEINVRRMCFFPEETGRSYHTVSGFKIDKAATTWAPPAAFQDGMIGPHWSKGWIIEDCDISNSKCSGISLGKYLDPDGTPITFDRDFYGDHRGIEVIPGPFAK